MRTTFVWRSAIRLPTVIEATDRIQKSGSTTSDRPTKAKRMSCRRATKPAVLESTDRKAVTGVGAPS